jgi:hypothetical protein
MISPVTNKGVECRTKKKWVVEGGGGGTWGEELGLI